MESEVHQFYGNKIRVRVCGICQVEDGILLVNHSGITKTNFWSPPGGGLNFGESVHECLKREFLEETGLTIEVQNFLFVCELIKHPLHAIELFFHVKPTAGRLAAGSDPEPGSPPIIKQVKYMSWTDVASLPPNELHGIFRYAEHPSKLTKLNGHFRL